MKPNFLFTCAIALAIFSCGKDEPLTFDEQLAVDVKIIDEYLAANNIQAEVHSSGLRYVVHDEGQGSSPVVTDRITVAYEGWYLPSGDLFDSSTGVTFTLGNLIVAWQEALPLILEGGSMTIYAPSGLCYGPDGYPQAGIPPNANMTFRLDLQEIVR